MKNKITILIYSIAFFSMLILFKPDNVNAQACTGFIKCLGWDSSIGQCSTWSNNIACSGSGCTRPPGVDCNGHPDCEVSDGCASGGGGGGGGGGPSGTAPTCPSGTSLVCDSPAVTTCKGKEKCWELFPSNFLGGYPSCDPSQASKKPCQTNCHCDASCTVTAPTITSINRDSATSATITWTPGTAQTGSVQKIFMSQDVNQVINDCTLTTSPGCVVNQPSLSASQTSYSTGNVLASGSVYYIKIVNYADATCNADSNSTNGYNSGSPFPYLSSCSITPASLNLQVSESGTVTSTVNTNSIINKVEFYSSNSSIISVTTPDTSYPYASTVTAVSAGSAEVKSSVYFTGGFIACTNFVGGNGTHSGGGPDGDTTNTNGGGDNNGGGTDTDGGGGGGNDGDTTTTISNLTDAWWQTKDSDITSLGSIESDIPSGNYFGLPGSGGYAGIPTFTTSTNLTSANASGQNWLTQNSNVPLIEYNYSYFEDLIPKDVVFNNIGTNNISGSALSSGGTQSYGYYWYKYDGTTSGSDLTITSAANLAGRKVILLVKGADLFIDGNISVTDGVGFFMTIVDNGINVSDSLGGSTPDLEGFYICDNQFDSGTSSNPLHIRGAVVAYDGIVMGGRNLGTGNATTPSNLFEYAPDQSLLFPGKLANRKISWKEVAP